MNQCKSSDENGQPVSKPKKKRGVWWVIKWGAIFTLLLVITLVLINFRVPPGKGNPFVRVSPQTTYATSPLKPNGDVDYVAYLNQQHAVTPGNNAFVELLKVKGPVATGRIPPAEFFQLLGINPLPAVGDYLVEFPWTRKSSGTSVLLDDGTALDSEQAYTITQTIPFPPGQFPEADAWFEENERHIHAIQMAVRKPGYYMPYVGNSMYRVDLSHAEDMRSIARSLERSSMARLGRGDIAGAIDAQVAILRLARHVSHSGSVKEQAVGFVLERIGYLSLAQTIFSGKCSAADLARLANELKALPAIPKAGASLLQTERVLALDAVIQIGRDGPIPWNGDPTNPVLGPPQVDPTIIDKLMRSSIDWETVCVTLNEEFDRMEATLATEGVGRAAIIQQFEAEMRNLERSVGTSSTMFRAAAAGRGSRSKMIGTIISALVTPAIRLELLLSAHDAITHVAIALQRYHLDHGNYPEDLDQLVPDYLSAIPLDPFTGNPLIYKPNTGDPFLLYSLGNNRIDDGGLENDGNYWQGDLLAAPKIRTVGQWIEANVEKETTTNGIQSK